MAKKNLNKNKKQKPKREPRRNVKQAPREHWKFKNSHVKLLLSPWEGSLLFECPYLGETAP